MTDLFLLDLLDIGPGAATPVDASRPVSRRQRVPLQKKKTTHGQYLDAQCVSGATLCQPWTN